MVVNRGMTGLPRGHFHDCLREGITASQKWIRGVTPAPWNLFNEPTPWVSAVLGRTPGVGAEHHRGAHHG